MADRREVIAIITADSRKLDPDLRKAKGKYKKFAVEVKGEIKQVSNSFRDMVGLGGMAGLMVAGKRVLDFQTRLVRLRQASSSSAATIKGLESAIFKMAKAKGLDPEAVLAGAEKFNEATGRLDLFTAGMESLGAVSSATGSALEEIAQVAADLNKTMGIRPEEWGASFDILARQGKAGAIELRNLASELPRVMPLFNQFGNTGVKGLGELGALMQMARGGFSTAAETGTGLQSLMAAVQKAAGKHKGNKTFFTGKGKNMKQRGLFDTITQIDQATKGDPFKIRALLRDKEAINAYLAIVKAGTGTFKDLTDSAKAAGTIASDEKLWDESPAKKMASAQAKLAEVFNEKMASNIETIAGALDKVADALRLISDHPYAAAAVFGGLKVGGMLGVGGKVGAAASGGLNNMAGALNGMGRMGQAFSLAAVFTAAYNLGTILNDATGASSMLAQGLWRMVNSTDAAAEELDQLRDVIRSEVHSKLKSQGVVSAGAFSASLQGQQVGAQRVAALLELKRQSGLGYDHDLTRAHRLQQTLGMSSTPEVGAIDKIISDQISLYTKRSILNPVIQSTGMMGADQGIAAALAQAGGSISDKQRELLMGKVLSEQSSSVMSKGTFLSQEQILKLILDELKRQRSTSGGVKLTEDGPRRRG